MKEKLKRICKKAVPLILVGVITSTTVMTNYHEAREVKAVAGVDDIALAALVTTILLSYGYVTTEYFNNSASANALAQQMQEAYDQARNRLIIFYNIPPDDDDGDDDDEDEEAKEEEKKNQLALREQEGLQDIDNSGKITQNDIPSFKDLVKQAGVEGAFGLAITGNVAKLLAPIVTKTISNKYGSISDSQSEISVLTKINANLDKYVKSNNIDLSSYKYFCKYKSKGGYTYYYYSDVMYYNSVLDAMLIVGRGDYGDHIFSIAFDNLGNVFRNDNLGASVGSWGLQCKNGNFSYHFTNAPTCSSREEFDNYTRVDWVTPELEKTFDNKSNLELLPAYDTNYNYNMASQQALQQLLNNLTNNALSTAQQQQLVNDYLQSLKTETKTNPDTSTEPEPEPEPNPNPDDKGDSDKKDDAETNNKSFTADLKTLFPFCIPFDLIDCVRLFNAEPETPYYEFPVHIPIVNIDYTFVIDLSDFDSVAVVCRTMFLILYIIGLILATRQLIRG